MQSRTATIVDTYLGDWAEGVLVAFLLVDFGGAIRAVGGQLLNSDDGAASRAYGEQFALRLMRACGARRWADLDGRTIEVLFDAPFPLGNAIGVRSGETPAAEPFIFDDWRRETGKDEQPGAALAAVGVPRPLQAPPGSLVSAI